MIPRDPSSTQGISGRPASFVGRSEHVADTDVRRAKPLRNMRPNRHERFLRRPGPGRRSILPMPGDEVALGPSIHSRSVPGAIASSAIGLRFTCVEEEEG